MARNSNRLAPFVTGPFWEVRSGEFFSVVAGGQLYQRTSGFSAITAQRFGDRIVPDRDAREYPMEEFALSDVCYLPGPSPRWGITSLRRLVRGGLFMAVRPADLQPMAAAHRRGLLSDYGTCFSKQANAGALCPQLGLSLYGIDPQLMVYGLRRIAGRLCDTCYGAGFVVQHDGDLAPPYCEACTCLRDDFEEATDHLRHFSGIVFDEYQDIGVTRITLPCWSHLAHAWRASLNAPATATTRPLLHMPRIGEPRMATREVFARFVIPADRDDNWMQRTLQGFLDVEFDVARADRPLLTLEILSAMPKTSPEAHTPIQERTRVVQLDELGPS